MTAIATQYSIPMSNLTPQGLFTNQDLDIIAEMNWDEDGRGVYRRGEWTVTYEVPVASFDETYLRVGYARTGKRVAY